MIVKIKWSKHPILNNLELNFADNFGHPYKNIVLAGENGCGKTAVLESILSLLNGRRSDFVSEVSYENGGLTKSITFTPNAHYQNALLSELRQFGYAYSKARSGFKTDPITYVGTSQIDSEKYVNDDADNFTSIKQLLVDLDAIDNADWADLSRNSNHSEYSDFEKGCKLHRFRESFNLFFDDIKFEKIDHNSPDEKKIIFSKGETRINIDQLSTGEKQIVFRGTHLLKNSRNIDGGIILIDEPELSMHPRWQSKILDFYKRLFIKNNQQNVQMFFATHSEYVLKAALKSPDTLVIVLRSEKGLISSDEIRLPFFLPTITSGEINYFAFNMISVDYHISLYSHYQQMIGENTILKVDKCIMDSSFFDSKKHYKPNSYGGKDYKTLPTYIRNAIDHPDTHPGYSENELKESILLLQKLCGEFKK